MDSLEFDTSPARDALSEPRMQRWVGLIDLAPLLAMIVLLFFTPLTVLSFHLVFVPLILARLWPFVSEREGALVTSPMNGVIEMRTLPTTVIQVLAPFAPLISRHVWQHVQLLLAAALTTPGKRMVASGLRMVGKGYYGGPKNGKKAATTLLKRFSVAPRGAACSVFFKEPLGRGASCPVAAARRSTQSSPNRY